MSILTIVEVEGQLVVDSRLIADELGVTHKALKETIRNHQAEIEEEFGVLPFETAKLENEEGRPETFYWLNEEQATYVMTLSRNTTRWTLAP